MIIDPVLLPRPNRTVKLKKAAPDGRNIIICKWFSNQVMKSAQLCLCAHGDALCKTLNLVHSVST